MLLAQTASLPQPVPPHKEKEADGRRKCSPKCWKFRRHPCSTASPRRRKPRTPFKGGGKPTQCKASLRPTGTACGPQGWGRKRKGQAVLCRPADRRAVRGHLPHLKWNVRPLITSFQKRGAQYGKSPRRPSSCPFQPVEIPASCRAKRRECFALPHQALPLRRNGAALFPSRT